MISNRTKVFFSKETCSSSNYHKYFVRGLLIMKQDVEPDMYSNTDNI